MKSLEYGIPMIWYALCVKWQELLIGISSKTLSITKKKLDAFNEIWAQENWPESHPSGCVMDEIRLDYILTKLDHEEQVREVQADYDGYEAKRQYYLKLVGVYEEFLNGPKTEKL